MEVGYSVCWCEKRNKKDYKHLWQWERAREEAEGYKVQPTEATKRTACYMSLMTQIRRLIGTTLLLSVTQKTKLSSIWLEYTVSLLHCLLEVSCISTGRLNAIVSNHPFSPEVCHLIHLIILVAHSASS